MEDISKNLRLSKFSNNLDAVLQDSSPLAAHRVGYNRRRNEVIGMEDNHVVRIVDDALSGCVEFANQVDIKTFTAWAVEPGLSQNDHFLEFSLLLLD